MICLSQQFDVDSRPSSYFNGPWPFMPLPRCTSHLRLDRGLLTSPDTIRPEPLPLGLFWPRNYTISEQITHGCMESSNPGQPPVRTNPPCLCFSFPVYFCFSLNLSTIQLIKGRIYIAWNSRRRSNESINYCTFYQLSRLNYAPCILYQSMLFPKLSLFPCCDTNSLQPYWRVSKLP